MLARENRTSPRSTIKAHFGSGPTARPAFNQGGANQTSRPAPAQRPERTNAYGAKCADCGVWVEPGQGRLTNGNGGWRVSHIPPCPEREATPNVVSEPLVVSTPAPNVDFKVPEGRYTISFADGHKTLRVTRQDKDADFMPGRVLLSYLSGSDNDRDYTRFGHVDESGSVRIWKKHLGNTTLLKALKVLLGDPKAASQAYALQSGCCGVCGRTLTTPESIDRGIGPVCAEKAGF